MQRARALLAALRPIGWIPFLFSLVLGLADAGFVSLREVALSLIIFGPLLSGGIYVVNFYSDIEIDRRSSVVKDLPMREQPFVTGALGAKRALIMAALLFFSAVSLSLLINLQFLLLCVYVIVILTMYSLPPRLKERPIGDVFANSTTAGFASYAAGWAAFKPLGELPLAPALWVTFLVAATYLLTVIMDIEDDRKAGVTTTATFLGPKKTIALSSCLYSLSFMLFLATLLARWFTLAYWLILPAVLKGPFTYRKLYRDPKRVYHVARRAVQSAAFGILLILGSYVLLRLLGIRVDEVANSILRFFLSAVSS